MDWDRRRLIGGLAAGAALATSARAAEPGVSDTPLPRLLNNHRVIIDTDPGNDDAIAILMALAAPNLKVEAITVTPGNIRYDQEVKNALYMVELAGMAGKIPVHAGMTRPLLNKPYPAATFIHGPDGLGKVVVPPVKQKPEAEHAVDAIRRIVKAYPREVVIVALGGLTNVAAALLLEPGIAPLIKGIQWVASAGNAVPGFNALVDPEAADIVFKSGAPITFGMGQQNASLLLKSDFDRIATFKTRKSEFFMLSNELRLTFEMSARNAPGSVNADPIAMAMIIDPSIGLAFKAVHAKVELEGELTRAVILYGDNRYNMEPTPPANANLCVEADNAKFKALLFKTLQKLMRLLIAWFAALLALAATPAAAACVSAKGDGWLLIRATVLTDARVLRPGEVLVTPDGRIDCVGKCAAKAPRAARLDCPDALLSPGFINPHEHLDFGNIAPEPDSGLRYTHRHDWRKGMNGFKSLETFKPTRDPSLLAWMELRHLLAGETSLIGEAMAPGLVRNLDFAAGLEGLDAPPATYNIFPLDDVGGTQRTADCDYGPKALTTEQAAKSHALVIHLGEGISEAARNEERCTVSATYDATPAPGGGGVSNDILDANVAVLHGVGFDRPMLTDLRKRGVSLVWSPRSNLALYGKTLDLAAVLDLKFPLALGTDWLPSGSMTMPREAVCALSYASSKGLPLSGHDIWSMMTANAAKAVQLEGRIGVIQPGALADLILVDRRGLGDPYLAVATAPPQAMMAVLRGGRLLAGDAALVRPLAKERCEPLAMAGRAKLVCLSGDAGATYAELKGKADAANLWPAFFTEAPPLEPPCVEAATTPVAERR